MYVFVYVYLCILYVCMQSFFFPVNIEKMPVNIFENLPVNIFFCPWTVQKKLAREPKKVPVNTKKVSVNLKSAREHFHKICRSWAFTGTFYVFTGTFFLLIPKNCPWTAKSTREHFKILCPWTTEKCPWKRPKKCPWTQPVTREPSEQSARERKIVPVKIFQNRGSRALLRFTGKKNTDLNYDIWTDNQNLEDSLFWPSKILL